ncbi:hypothetical protein ABZT28_33240 [Streptomyces sp. NPDC005388]|uniref:hypothetical protein n=1 Tax=Streptomyces sp. NPDC005388 TaxID=3156717 RepID=UPI0033B2C758
MSGRSILRLSFDLPPHAAPELPERLRPLLEGFTPRVQMLEDGALLDLTGATRWWQRDARGITELVQLRVLAYFGVRSAAAVAGTRIRQVHGFLHRLDGELASPWTVNAGLCIGLCTLDPVGSKGGCP